MKIRLLKNHNGAKVGSEHDISEDAANYLVRVGVAEIVTEKPVLDFNPAPPITGYENKIAKPVKQIKPRKTK